MTQQSTLTGEQLWQRNNQWLLSQWEHSNPVYLAPQLRNGSGSFYSNNWVGGGRCCPWQGINNHRAKRSTHSLSNACSGHYISRTYYQGIVASIHWGKRQQISILNIAITPKKYQTHTGSTGTCVHKDTSLRSPWIIFSPNFINQEKYK